MSPAQGCYDKKMVCERKKVEQEKMEQAVRIMGKHGVSIKYLESLLGIFNLDQIDHMLDFVGKEAGESKAEALKSLPKAALALHKVVPESERTAYLLCWMAEIAQETIAERLKLAAEPGVADLLQENAYLNY